MQLKLFCGEKLFKKEVAPCPKRQAVKKMYQEPVH
jgi:hypothetical protein